MLDARRKSVVGAVLAGLGAGALAWLVLGSSAVESRIDTLEATVSTKNAVPRIDTAATSKALLSARASPLFQRPPSAAAPSTVRLEGVAIRPGANSALIAVGGGAAKWVNQGETSDGVSLMQVRSGAAVVETASGGTTLMLGQTWTPGDATVATAP